MKQTTVKVDCAHDVLLDTETLVPNPRNPNKHPQKQLDLLAKIIQTQGFRNPIVVSNRSGFIVKGHARLEAAKMLGLKQCPVDYQDYENEAAEWADMIADNRLAELAEPSLPELKDLLEEMDTGDFDMDLTGFDNQDLENLMTSLNPDRIDEDNFDLEAEVDRIKDPTVKQGDLYGLGHHRLICGDSLSADTYAALLKGKPVDMVFTDPPYNVNYKGTKSDGILNDNMDEDSFIAFCEAFVHQMGQNLKPGGVFYLCSGWSSYPPFLYAIKAAGLEFANPIVWVKNNTSMGWNDYRYKYEMIVKGKAKKARQKKATPILYGWNKGRHYFVESRFESDVWEVKRRASNSMLHPMQKPLALIAKAVMNSSHPKGVVLDMFAGSGATLITCEKTGRIFAGIELDRRYCDVIIQRWQNFTGKEAVKLE